VSTVVWRNRSARARDLGRWERLEQPGGWVQGPALPSESTVHFVLDLALRIGDVQMSSGAGASDATATIIAVANAYGMPHCEVDVIFTSITVACHRGVDLPPVTSLRVVRSRSLDYTRLALVEQLVRDITRGRTTARDAHTQLDRITSAPHPYPRWLATAAYAGMAAAVSVLIGGGTVVALFAAVITALVDRVGRLLNKRASSRWSAARSPPAARSPSSRRTSCPSRSDRRSWSPRPSPCCCPACRSCRPCRTPSPGTT
jgi:hypothetical protein